MTAEETKLKGCYMISPKVFEDARGEFFEAFNSKLFQELTNIKVVFVQDNQSISKKGVLRGLHYQVEEFAQAKLVRVIQGEVLDVCVDLRPDSDTFGEHFSTILNSKLNKQLYVPKGFAHGFLTLSETAILSYKCDSYYNKAAERGIIYNDPILAIDWNYNDKDILLSEKDKLLPLFKSLF